MDFLPRFDTRPLDNNLLIDSGVISCDDFIESDFFIEIDFFSGHIPIGPVE